MKNDGQLSSSKLMRLTFSTQQEAKTFILFKILQQTPSFCHTYEKKKKDFFEETHNFFNEIKNRRKR